MNDEKHAGPQAVQWTSRAAKTLGSSESVVLVLIGLALVLVAVLLLYSAMHDLNEAVHMGPGEIERKSIGILNTVLLVMMTMEIVYTVAISLESHTLNAEPFLIIGIIAGIRRMLVITATATEQEVHPEQFHNTLVELGLLAATVVALAGAIGSSASVRTASSRGTNARADGHGAHSDGAVKSPARVSQAGLERRYYALNDGVPTLELLAATSCDSPDLCRANSKFREHFGLCAVFIRPGSK